MEQRIKDKLIDIEREQHIKILFAAESGSRAWGFPSPDSDYDVRFIFIRATDDYLTIQKKADQLTFPIDDELDISGWELGKTLQLITKSNSSPFEWLQSPVVYNTTASFHQDMWTLCQHYFCARTNAHHYIGIAKGAMNSLKGDELKIKKLFYILRPLLAALWCVDKGSIPPMNIYPLLELLPANLKQIVHNLIDLKASSEERCTIPITGILKLWIDETFDYCTQKSQSLEKVQFDIKEADTFFRKTIKK
ncbi:nucleotidyltransferase domain-containing protein [Bacteroides sp. 519]|uniref:nucleotidyltransferase domain-containing protein n=1 Tax=Bacteroides sp. 519 TaxID=2302937 RepID=UPI0013D7AEFF|nr:nucleotidyltransferase domain-containing protein [Bacteroides sp. 519]NDV58411.1 nucleotidyltransferase domain-containing protein [Bacteroides sp. 519]